MTFIYTESCYGDMGRVGGSQGLARKVDIVIVGEFR